LVKLTSVSDSFIFDTVINEFEVDQCANISIKLICLRKKIFLVFWPEINGATSGIVRVFTAVTNEAS